MKIACPHCAAPLDVDPKYSGQTAPCPHCSNRFVIPVLTAGIVQNDGTNTKKIAIGVTGGILGAIVVIILIIVILLFCFTTPTGKPSALETIRNAAESIEQGDRQP